MGCDDDVGGVVGFGYGSCSVCGCCCSGGSSNWAVMVMWVVLLDLGMAAFLSVAVVALVGVLDYALMVMWVVGGVGGCGTGIEI